MQVSATGRIVYYSFFHRFPLLLLLLGLLDYGLCYVEVPCKSKILETDEPDLESCYIINYPFPKDKPSTDEFDFIPDYTNSTQIKHVHLLNFDSSSLINYIPHGTFTSCYNAESINISRFLNHLNYSDLYGPAVKKLYFSRNELNRIENSVFSAITRIRQSMEHPIDYSEIKVEGDGDYLYRKLVELHLDKNEISEIDDYSFYGLISLTDLSLMGNRLTIIRVHTLAGLPTLDFLDLSENEIETIENGALDLPMLRVLRLEKNRLKTLSDVVFDHLPKLSYIVLEENELEHIGQSLYALPSADHINLGRNRIQDIDLAAFARMPTLKDLALQQSGFTFATTNIDDDQEWNSDLRMLNIMDNDLTDATELKKLRIFPNLIWLGLDGNPYTNLSIDNKTLFETPKPVLQHPIVQNMFFSLGKPYMVPRMDWITPFLPKQYRTVTDVLPKLTDLSLRRTNIDCGNMTSIARGLKLHHVRVKSDCRVSV